MDLHAFDAKELGLGQRVGAMCALRDSIYFQIKTVKTRLVCSAWKAPSVYKISTAVVSAQQCRLDDPSPNNFVKI